MQAPQDYRDDDESAFKAMCYAEYRGFFHIGMVTRNERNAIIQHGTMTLVRREALERSRRLGGVVHHRGCRARAAPVRARLRGAVPAAQLRPRPDAGDVHRLQEAALPLGVRRGADSARACARAVLARAIERLTRGQRYHFIAGWLPWLADGLNLLFNVAALGWSIAMIVAPHRIDPPLIMFSVLPLSLFTFKLVKLAHLYAARVGANIRQTLAAALAGLALSHTIGVAVVKALFTRNEPFVRTPKSKQPHALAEGIAAARTESLMLIAMLIAALGLTRSVRKS